jgi:hypothetical protein
VRFGRVRRLFSRLVRRLVRTPFKLCLSQIDRRRRVADEGVGLDTLGFGHHLCARFLEAALALRAERVLEIRADVSRAGELEEGFRVLLVRNVPGGRECSPQAVLLRRVRSQKTHSLGWKLSSCSAMATSNDLWWSPYR